MNIKKLMKQAEQMQAKLQSELGDMRAEASSGGAVTVTVNGAKEVLAVEIDPEVITPEEREMLQDLIVTAVNEANRKMDEMVRSKMGNLTQGMPGL